MARAAPATATSCSRSRRRGDRLPLTQDRGGHRRQQQRPPADPARAGSTRAASTRSTRAGWTPRNRQGRFHRVRLGCGDVRVDRSRVPTLRVQQPVPVLAAPGSYDADDIHRGRFVRGRPEATDRAMTLVIDRDMAVGVVHRDSGIVGVESHGISVRPECVRHHPLGARLSLPKRDNARVDHPTRPQLGYIYSFLGSPSCCTALGRRASRPSTEGGSNPSQRFPPPVGQACHAWTLPRNASPASPKAVFP